MSNPKFQMETSVDEATGRLVAVYLRVRGGSVANTEEVLAGVAYADYDAKGSLLGVELLGPCRVAVLDQIAEHEPESVREFLRGGAPRALITAE